MAAACSCRRRIFRCQQETPCTRKRSIHSVIYYFLRAVEKVELKQLIIQGTNACAVVSYEYVSPIGAKLHQDDAEVWKVVDGNIVALTIYFDITEFRTFMER